MFTPSSCQELVKTICRLGHPVSPSGTNDRLVGDKRAPRRGQMRISSETKTESIVNQ